VLNFGAAPAFLLYEAQLHELGAGGLAVAVIYLLAGTYRLARYNVCEDAHSKTRCTVGLPIPIAAAFLLAAVLIRNDLDAVWSGVVVLSMVGLMVSRWRLPTLTGTDMVSMLLVFNLINYAVLVVAPSLYLAAWWFAWMLISALVASVRDRRLEPNEEPTAPAHEAR
jgi:phosphatidylserine synthase